MRVQTQNFVDLIISDLRIASLNGIGLLGAMHEIDADARTRSKLWVFASDFINKLSDIDTLHVQIKKTLQHVVG